MSAYEGGGVIVGIDASTHAIDMVKLDLDSDRAEWTRHPLVADGRAWDRIQAARDLHMAGTYWDDVILVGIEQPAGRGDSPLLISIVVGVVLAAIPSRIPVFRFMPGEWRKRCGMSGNASKHDIASWVYETILHRGDAEPDWTTWPQDALDAFAIAYAARALNEQQEAA